jgi:hypothetical protein
MRTGSSYVTHFAKDGDMMIMWMCNVFRVPNIDVFRLDKDTVAGLYSARESITLARAKLHSLFVWPKYKINNMRFVKF